MMMIHIPSRFQVKIIKLHKQRGENALVPSTRIRDLTSKKDYNYLEWREIIWVNWGRFSGPDCPNYRLRPFRGEMSWKIMESQNWSRTIHFYATTFTTLILPGQLQMWSEKFHLYSFIKLTKNEWGFKALFSHFCWIVAMETMTVMKILISIFGEYFQVV